MELIDPMQRFQAIAGLGKHLEGALGFEHISNAHPDYRVVIGNNNSNAVISRRSLLRYFDGALKLSGRGRETTAQFLNYRQSGFLGCRMLLYLRAKFGSLGKAYDHTATLQIVRLTL